NPAAMPHQLALLAFLASLACASASVPAVVVSSRGSVDSLASLSSARLNSQQLAEALHRSAGGLLLVVTVDEGLSLPDFARSGGDVYSAGQGSASPFASVAGLSEKLGGRHLLVAEADKLLPALRSLDWRGGAPIDVANDGKEVDRVVEAATAAGGASRLVLARAADAGAADRLLGAACAALQSRGLPFVAVFTATHESDPAPAAADAAASAEAAVSAGRHLLAAPTASPSSNGTFVNCSSDVLLYFASLQVQLTQNSKVKTLPPVLPVADGSSIIDTKLSTCNAAGGNRTLALSFPDSALQSPLAALKLTLNFVGDTKSSTSPWSIASGTASLSCKSGSSANCTNVAETSLTQESLASFITPNGSCYHCTNNTRLSTSGGTGSNGSAALTLIFGKFQLQPFGIPADGKFSKNVNDCVGFFSVEVWFSLLVLLVITVILMYGVLMLVSVATPDRFDDPKGKTIQVNVQDGGN
ncbi:hypothetical protein BOX15_Mlig013561g2, partial [Macrostomum lignano]